jgi:polyferredoxin
MTAEPPLPAEPPVFEERRRIPDRRQSERRTEDQSRYLRTAAAAAIAICGGLSIVYMFFAAIGAVNLKNALAATITAIVLALVWFAGYYIRHRAAAGRSSSIQPLDRERRGF